MAKKIEDFKGEIKVGQCYFSRDYYNLALSIDDPEQRLAYYDTVLEYLLNNTYTDHGLDPYFREQAEEVIGVHYYAINKYRWDVFNGLKGGYRRHRIDLEGSMELPPTDSLESEDPPESE